MTILTETRYIYTHRASMDKVYHYYNELITVLHICKPLLNSAKEALDVKIRLHSLFLHV